MKNEFGNDIGANGYADSIVTFDMDKCFLCGASDEKLDRHECFGGPFRAKSKRLGLWVPLCHTRCHIFGPDAVENSPANRRFCQQAAQKAAMQTYHWDTADFIMEFGRNYL